MNIQNILNQTIAIVFYALIFIWIYYKVCNVVLINKNNCVQQYKELKKQFCKRPIAKFLLIITIISLIILAIYIVFVIISVVAGIFGITVEIFTFGTVSNGMLSFADSNLTSFITALPYAQYITDIPFYAYVIRAIYINVNVNKLLKTNQYTDTSSNM